MSTMFGEGGELALSLISASMNANYETMDRLYETEVERRRALEVHIYLALDRFAAAWGGTVREYEAAVGALRNLPYGDRERELAAIHPDAVSA
jgi:hypothetical protein